jgi:hypothetical protein
MQRVIAATGLLKQSVKDGITSATRQVKYATVGPDLSTPHYKRANGGIIEYTPGTNVRQKTELQTAHWSKMLFRYFAITVIVVGVVLILDLRIKFTNKVEEDEKRFMTTPTSVFNFAADFNEATIDFESTTTKTHFFGLFIDPKNTPEKLLSDDNTKG